MSQIIIKIYSEETQVKFNKRILKVLMIETVEENAEKGCETELNSIWENIVIIEHTGDVAHYEIRMTKREKKKKR